MNYYDILGVEKNASLESIMRAKDRLKFGSGDDKAPFSMWPIIDEAYSVLSNFEERKKYDEKLERGLPLTANPEPPKMSGTGLPSNNSSKKKEEEYDLNYVSKFKPITSPNYAGGAIIGFTFGGLIGAIVVPVCMKLHNKAKLNKNQSPKKVTKISTVEMNLIENYNETLDAEINKLLSEPHNNYKLEINKLKYTKQQELLERLLQVKLNKEPKRFELLLHKLDVVSTKMQLETTKKNYDAIIKKIEKYEKEQRLSNLNKKIIKVNQEIKSREGEKSFGFRRLNAYQSRLLKKRDRKATDLKFLIVKSGKAYDSFLKAKDFVISLPYMVKSSEKIDEFVQDESQRIR